MWKFKKPSQLSLSQSLIKLKKELKKKEKKSIPKRELTLEEITLVQQIQDQTKDLNKNNVTRTKAYLEFYNRHPEIHWAFLGHMVSRNGGWNMTDLKGGLLTDLLTQKERVSFFAFLERGNWLIFQDAFPQFLIYEESMKRGQNLFYLLPYFHVSMFMETLWNQFWEEQDSYVLTVALIINEQSYLESRVLQNPSFKKEVFSKLEFKLQDLLSMNHILFPYFKNGKIQLAGETLHHFESLHERILLGKRLYAILFSDQHRLKMTEIWAKSHPHSGSRKDYWPHIFNDINEGVPGKALKPRIRSCKIVPGSLRIYSPKLAFAWKNREHKQAEIVDWFQNWNVVKYLTDSGENIDGEIENDYCKTLERLEFAAITKKAMFLLD